MLVERLQDADRTLHRPALEALRTQIRSSAVSLTSVPKALKFLRNQYRGLVDIQATLPDGEDQVILHRSRSTKWMVEIPG